MSAFVLNRNYELQLPNSFVDVDREEMEYVEGGGTVKLTLTYGTIAFLVAKVGVGWGLRAALSGLNASIGCAIVFGTAGWGTLFAAVGLAAFQAAIPWVAGAIARSAVNGRYAGSGISINIITTKYLSNRNITI